MMTRIVFKNEKVPAVTPWCGEFVAHGNNVQRCHFWLLRRHLQYEARGDQSD